MSNVSGYRIFVLLNLNLYVMKTIKRILMAGTLVATLSATANNDKLIVGNNSDVTITNSNETVDISILNTQNNTYTLYIYNPNGELVFKQSLGNDASLGKRFNFEWAHKGDYTFTFVTNQGERSSYQVKTGLN
ncbi:MAG: hypothetical protein DWP94_08055 [Flavobacterium sp.]|nr:MAG: hypothetical protein DWP94_08055 [Flavobacterium sp.]